jgi:hypothetical protein
MVFGFTNFRSTMFGKRRAVRNPSIPFVSELERMYTFETDSNTVVKV